MGAMFRDSRITWIRRCREAHFELMCSMFVYFLEWVRLSLKLCVPANILFLVFNSKIFGSLQHQFRVCLCARDAYLNGKDYLAN